MIEYLDGLLFSISWPWSLVLIIGVMAVIGVLAFLKQSLDLSGTISAVVMGVIVLWCTQLEGFLLLLLFFVGSNVVGRLSKRIRRQTSGELFIEQKGSRRDSMQVLSNGLMATLGALMWYCTGKLSALVMFGAAIAEATSDTFAGEIGRLSKKPPVSIRTLTPVPKGLSGGITLLGTATAFIASLVIALSWFIFFGRYCASVSHGLLALSIIAITGFMGCIVDSYLGACAQAHYRDPVTGELTEKEYGEGPSACGSEGKTERFELVQGIRWIDNDMVNLLSNLFSAVFALGMSTFVFAL